MFKNLDNADRQAVEMLKRMAILAEYRDDSIRSHLERIRGYTYILSTYHGLSTIEAEVIANASLVHDIGKVGLPVELQFTPAKLSPIEQETLKKHVGYGVELLRGATSKYLNTAENIILNHHERWDGSGYPQGLVGDEISLGGRIMAVADVFDALTTPRAYKADIPVENAHKLIRDSGGTLFDPAITKVFSDHFDDIIRIRQAFLSG